VIRDLRHPKRCTDPFNKPPVGLLKYSVDPKLVGGTKKQGKEMFHALRRSLMRNFDAPAPSTFSVKKGGKPHTLSQSVAH
jgi:hypothetical protein